MAKANHKIELDEVRMFNFIKIDGEEVCMSHHKMAELFHPDNASLWSKLEGIPLDADWIQDYFNFDYREEDDAYFLPIAESLYLEFDADMRCGIMPEDYTTQPPLRLFTNIQYVHQVQNLYFYLTGKDFSSDDEDDD
jgi:hypothetical protein